MQQAILRAEVVEANAGWWKHQPEVVLGEVPVGTPVDEARRVMTGHGFACENRATGDGHPFLFCKAFKSHSWVAGTAIEVWLYHEAGRITNADVVTRYDGL